MKKENILFAALGIFIGFGGGFFLANSINRRELSRQTVSQNTTNAPFQNQQTQAADIKEPQAQGKPLPEVSEKLDKAKNEPNNFDAQIQAGKLYLQIKGFDKAQEFFDKAEQLNPIEYGDFVELGNDYSDVGKFEKAEKWYMRALEKKPDDINVRTDLGITFVERSRPDLDRAIKEFQTALQVNPKFEPALYNLGIASHKKGDAAQAENSLSQLESINPQGQPAQSLRQILAQK
ncbi:MAG: tetratricopeptide repeat protein [Acidobacteriota bacterium]|nr:tetratricopeptide repeat protein [Acidobacteriota bacterium]